MQDTKFALNVLTTAMALALAACGGGGGGDDAASPTPAPTPAPAFTVQGSALAVNADPLAIIFVPTDATSSGLSPRAGTTASAPATLQTTTPEGAYKVLAGNQATITTLASGTIAEVKGNGAYAIGRWTNGTSNTGNISVNQGAHYAVGKPNALTRTPGPASKLNCSLVASTNPTAVSGNFAPGKVNTAVAVIDLNGPLLDTFTIDAEIGADANITRTISGAPVTGVSLSANGAYQIETMGSDQARPLLAVGYTIPTPSSGDVTGVVVLQCQ